jgi:hypothetical protein
VSGKVIIHVEIICSQEKKDNVRVWLGASLLLLLLLLVFNTRKSVVYCA